MDPDTTRKVSELLNLMEDISSDVDAKSGLAVLSERIETLQSRVESLEGRFERIEELLEEKSRRISSLKQDLKSLFPEA
jgi:prefoldin subunit 5